LPVHPDHILQNHLKLQTRITTLASICPNDLSANMYYRLHAQIHRSKLEYWFASCRVN